MAPSFPRITAEQRARYERHGFVVLGDFAEPAACDALVARARALVDAFEPPAAASVFASG